MKSLAMAMEDFNAEMTQIQHDLDEYGYGYGPGGELVLVHTPWAMGFVDRQGVPLT